MKGRKSRLTAAALAAGVLLGAARAFDLLCATDAETGFLTAGSVLPRYGAWLAGAALCVCAGLQTPARRACGVRAVRRGAWLWLAVAGCAAWYAGICARRAAARGADSLSELRTLPPGAAGALHAAGAVTFAALALFGILRFCECRWGQRFGVWPPVTGVLGSAALVLQLCRVILLQDMSGPYRLAYPAALFGTLAVLWFFLHFLRAAYLPATQPAPALCRSGLLAFVFGCCVLLPQSVWLAVHPGAAHMAAGPGLLEALLGVLGAKTALRIAGENDTGGTVHVSL